MKKHLIVIGMTLMLLAVGLCGCTDINFGEVTQFSITTFKVEPSLIEAGDTANLSWVVMSAQIISIDNGIGNVSNIGNRIIMPTETTTYTLTATNSTSTKTATTQIIVRDETYYITPTLTFIKEDKATVNTLTVIAADPADLSWGDLELQIDGTATNHGKTGTVTAGTILDITALAGTGAYTIGIRHIPTNTLIGTYSFTAAS